MPDHWKKVTPPIDVGFQFDYYACRYCDAKVINEYGPWYEKTFPGSYTAVKVRDATPRVEWIAVHELWCIVPSHLVANQ